MKADQVNPKGRLATALRSVFETFNPVKAQFALPSHTQLYELWQAYRESAGNAEYDSWFQDAA